MFLNFYDFAEAPSSPFPLFAQQTQEEEKRAGNSTRLHLCDSANIWAFVNFFCIPKDGQTTAKSITKFLAEDKTEVLKILQGQRSNAK